MAVVGAREAENELVALRKHGQGSQGTLSVSQLIEKLSMEVESKETGMLG
jgi:threonyl-tRNA synthetase